MNNKKDKRVVVFHYHIFKNAGSTIDNMLKNNFGSSWVTYDGEKAHSRISPDEVESFVSNHPKCRAISSHNATLPIPQINDIDIVPIIFLRHPLDRLRSIYDFERHQGLTAGPVSRGADHASKLNFKDYIRWRFDFTVNGVTHNHHTAWLLHHPRFNRLEIQQQDYEQAMRNLKNLPFFGLVEQFDESLFLLSSYLKELNVEIKLDYQVKNRSKHYGKSLDERLEEFRLSIDKEIWNAIELRNKWDLQLYEMAKIELLNRIKRSGSN